MSTFLAKLCPRCFGRFKPCNFDDYKQAIIEVVIVAISAFLPLWAGAVLLSLTTIPSAVSHYVHDFMTSGEMLLIACAVIGPLIYILSRRYGKLTDPLTLRFPYSTGFSVVILFIWFISGGVFVMRKGAALYGTSPTLFNDVAMWNLSAGIGVVAVGILFFATLFRNCIERIDPAALMHEDQEDFVRDFRNG